MLIVYGVSWCPHCKKIVRHLVENHIDFKYLDIEEQPEDVVNQVKKANGGNGWRVPTLEYNGKWIPGKVYDRMEVDNDLRSLGVI